MASEKRNYDRWTKEGLIRRIKHLEQQLEKQTQQGTTTVLASSAAPASSSTQEQQGRMAAPTEQAQAQTQTLPSKKRKAADPSNYSTRFIALKLAYLGGNYNGFEYQANGQLPTVEEELWKALVKTCLVFPERGPDEVDFSSCEYSKCGRTDRGVSAFGQVVALRVRSNRPVPRARGQQKGTADPPAETGDGAAIAVAAEPAAAEATGEGKRPQEEDDDKDGETPYPVADEIKYCKLLNRTLPPDIRALAWCPTPPPGFSARFSCRERQYRYFFTQPAFAPMPSVLENVSSSSSSGRHIKDGYLDIEAMREAARYFEGSHDFRNFCKIDPSKQIANFERRVLEADIVEVPDVTSALPYLDRPEFLPGHSDGGGYGDASAVEPRSPRVYYFHVRGTAFLWHQIRHMVAVLFLVGQGLEKPSVVADLLDVSRYPGRPNYHLASDVPLVLWDCLFGRPPPGGAGSSEAVEPGPDLDWVYAGEDGGPIDLHGPKGLVGGLWEVWRGRKMDELLANRLLDRVAELTDPVRAVAASAAAVEVAAVLKGGSSNKKAKQQRQPQRGRKAFEGGDGPHLIGTYMPLAKRQMQATPEEVNDRWAQSKGFANAAELAGTENWRSVIKARKLAAAVDS